MKIPNIYEGKHYKKLILIPLALIFISLFFIKDIPRGVDLRGGSLINVVADLPQDQLAAKRIELESSLKEFSKDITVRVFENPTGRGFEIEVGANADIDAAGLQLSAFKEMDSRLQMESLTLDLMKSDKPDLAKIQSQTQTVKKLEADVLEKANQILLQLSSTKKAVDPAKALQLVESEYQNALTNGREELIATVKEIVPVKTYSSKEIGSSLSRFFLSKTAEIILVSLLIATIFVVILFRGVVASVAVLFGALADLIITAGAMGLLGIPLSLASLAALLMLIGFSIDTDMLLTIRALKRTEGNVKDRVYDAMKTAFVMNVSAITAFAVLFAISLQLQIDTYYQIGAVAMIGGLIDFIATWCGNAVLVLWYSEVKKN
ncbi:hypothetical protein HY989_05865 [Candidatus Micrarchaeota archaeon]|nr:hypothetical protein [Candidatus Micrarchaeota archaeon]